MSAPRELLIVAALVALLPILVALGPIAQPASYHDLADQRPILGIGHFWNVATNLPFLLVGLMGLRLLSRQREEAAAAWSMLFAGTALVAAGSSWYHSNPNDATLVWDRVPIGIAFMGFFTALLIEHAAGTARRIAQGLLFPSVAFSAAAIGWWYRTGDLSLWVWVQAAPMLAAALVLALLPARYTHRRYIGYALACYAVAKVVEVLDVQVMHWTSGLLGGHALKHLAAAAGVWCLYVMLRQRSALGEKTWTSGSRSYETSRSP
jgi:hypothetical protein